MTSGCIPIVHDSGGPREFVSSKFRYKTIEEAAEKIEKSLNSWNLQQAKNLSMNSHKFTEGNFSRSFIDLFNSYIKIKNPIKKQQLKS